MVSGMVYGIFLVLLCLWATGSRCLSQFGLKVGTVYLTGIVFGCFGLIYLVGVYYNFGLYNTNRFSLTVFSMYLLTAVIVSVFLVNLSVLTGLYLGVLRIKPSSR